MLASLVLPGCFGNGPEGLCSLTGCSPLSSPGTGTGARSARATVVTVAASSPDGAYGINRAIDIVVTFDRAVTVSGTPELELALTSRTEKAIYLSGSGTRALTFRYTVATNHHTPELEYASTSALSGTITTAQGAADLTLPAPRARGSLSASSTIEVDGIAPEVVQVDSASADGTYGIGQTVSVRVNFDSPVVVTGTPRLFLVTGTGITAANYASGSGTAALLFSYTVASGDNTLDLDYQSTGALDLTGASIRDAAGNPAEVTLDSPGGPDSLAGNAAIVIDGISPAVASVSSSTANGTYGIGQAITIRVQFNSVVNVTGTPQLRLATGGAGTQVAYSGGSGTDTLSFTYTVASGHVSGRLDYFDNASLTLNGGTINDTAGNPASLALANPGAANSLGANANLVIDGVAPTANAVSSVSANGTYRAGQTVTLRVTFSENVTVTGTPRLRLQTGAGITPATYNTGSGTSALTFNYTVASGDFSSDLDYENTSALELNGGTIRDAAGNAATLTLANPGEEFSLGWNANLRIDGVAPTVTNVTSTTADGTYGPPTKIPIQVTFSEIVNVTGTPLLTLETGTSDAVVAYTSGSGTTTLVFEYQITPGDQSTDLNYQSTGALAANGGTIRDAAGNDGNLTLPGLAAAGSLGTNKNLVVRPTITEFSVAGSENGAQLGFSVAAVDVNGDSYDEILVGEPTADAGGTDRGKVYIYDGRKGTLLTTLSGSEDGAQFGYSIAALGDFDRDGRNDFAVGSPFRGANDFGAVTVYSGRTLGSMRGFTFSDWSSGGFSIAGGGDLNKDGYPDIIIALPYSGGTSTQDPNAKGLVHVFTGKDGSHVFTLAGNEAGGLFGYSVAALGDINSDGRDDLIVGEPGADAGGTDRGRAYVYNGNAALIRRHDGTESLAMLGRTVAGAFNLNSDGKPDYLVGSPFSAGGGTEQGSVFSYSGANGNLLSTFTGDSASARLGSAIAAKGDFDGNGKDNLLLGLPNALSKRGIIRIFDGTSTLVEKQGTSVGDKFGHAVAFGDFNADGRADYVVGAPDVGGKGGFYVYTAPAPTVPTGSPTFLYLINGSEDGGQTGFSVAGGSDVNLDGRSDFLVGTPFFDAGFTDMGLAVLYSGASGNSLLSYSPNSSNQRAGISVALGGDINRDGTPDYLVGQPAHSSSSGRGAIINGATGAVITTRDSLYATAMFGASAAILGDADRDGNADYAFGAPLKESVFVYSGASHNFIVTISGSGTGSEWGGSIAAAGDWSGDGSPDVLIGAPASDKATVITVTGTSVSRNFTGTQSGARFGAAVANVGDVDRDGVNDFLIGEPLYDDAAFGSEGVDRGRATVFSGRDGATLYTYVGVQKNGQLGYSVAGLGDIDADGRPDFAVGAPYLDNVGADSGAVYVFRGSTGNFAFSVLGTVANGRLGFSLQAAGDVNGDGKMDIVMGEPGAGAGGFSRGRAQVWTSP